MGTAGWELRYNLCEPDGLPLEYMEVPNSAGNGSLRFPYYSNAGPIEGMDFYVMGGAEIIGDGLTLHVKRSAKLACP